jgi:YHS domain-containing protein
MQESNSRFGLPYLAAVIVLIFWATSSPGLDLAAAATQESQDAVIALDGLDPVLLVQGKEVPGKPAISATRGQYKYFFVNDVNKTLFEKDAARYEIQLGGSCARMGPQVGSNPDLFAVHKGRIYVFGSGECQRLFQESPEKYLEPIPADFVGSPEAIKEGQSLIQKAVAATGGDARLDGIKSYQETGSATATTESGDLQFKTVTTRVFPDMIRREQTRSFGTVTNVLAPAGSFNVFQNDTRKNVRSIREFQRADLEKQYKRNVLELLRARKQPDFKAAAVSAGVSGDSGIEQVAIALGDIRVRLGVDATNGRVLNLSFVGRSLNTGEIGEIVQTFSDFRDVDGLVIPFKVTGTFNGTADPQLSYTVESVAINVKVDPALFEKPKS